MRHTKRLERIERGRRAALGKMIFVEWDDGRITEGGEHRTQADIDDAERRGFDVVKIKIVYDEITKGKNE